MVQQPLISIIVPVYKVERYIRECMDSVRSQSFEDWEMILIDDGSPDKCSQICDEYAILDERIIAIHQENNGVSHARNTGIKNAKGKYLFFLDPDDFLPEDALKSLVEAGNKFNWPEYIKGSHYVVRPDNHIVATRFTPPNTLTTKHLHQTHLYQWSF